MSEPVKKHAGESTGQSELDLPVWAVISFERTEATALTYRQAAERMAELEAKGVAGLCMVTIEAADRVGRLDRNLKI